MELTDGGGAMCIGMHISMCDDIIHRLFACDDAWTHANAPHTDADVSFRTTRCVSPQQHGQSLTVLGSLGCATLLSAVHAGCERGRDDAVVHGAGRRLRRLRACEAPASQAGAGGCVNRLTGCNINYCINHCIDTVYFVQTRLPTRADVGRGARVKK